jgi:zeta-carotene desaturase
MTRTSSRHDVIIVGAGIAGMACALSLASRGVRPLVLETRKKLGGRATSFTDVRSAEILDNCQHVALGCCTNFLDFLGSIGTASAMTWYDDQYWFEPGGRMSIITANGLGRLSPAPGHYAASLLRATFLTLGEKVILSRGILDILSTDRSLWRDRTFDLFLRTSGQTDRLISRFWEPVIASACNLPCSRVAASSALHVFQEGFLAHRRSASIGIPSIPLVELYRNLPTLLESRGGEIRLGCSVDRLTTTSVTLSRTGETLHAPAVISAVPFPSALQIIDPGIQAADARFAAMRSFSTSPILGVHLRFDRPVLRTPHAVLVDQPTQWLFSAPGHTDGRAVHAVISAADAWLPLSEEQVASQILTDIRRCMPWAAEARLLSCRPVKEKLATIAPTPEMEAHRPAATAGPGSLILAGDYTDTGWPSTMEGAVRSGRIAAAVFLGLSPEALLCPSLPPGLLTMALGLRPPSTSSSPGYRGIPAAQPALAS